VAAGKEIPCVSCIQQISPQERQLNQYKNKEIQAVFN
jgi:hypothetical protein